MRKLQQAARDWVTSEGGQDLAEYAMLIGSIAVVIFIFVAMIGQSFLATFLRIAARVLAF